MKLDYVAWPNDVRCDTRRRLTLAVHARASDAGDLLRSHLQHCLLSVISNMDHHVFVLPLAIHSYAYHSYVPVTCQTPSGIYTELI